MNPPANAPMPVLRIEQIEAALQLLGPMLADNQGNRITEALVNGVCVTYRARLIQMFMPTTASTEAPTPRS